MLVKVLKTFPYAHDHRAVVTLEEGQIVDLDKSVVEGLHDEGFIDEPTAAELAAHRSGEAPVIAAGAADVEIPADWSSLHWFKQKALAEKLSGAAVADKKSAVAVIESHLQARSEA